MAGREREGKEKEEKKKVVKRKERKPKVKRPGWKVYKVYSISGEKLERKNKHCPKCGKGVLMGKHKDRLVCGKCRYVEYEGKG